ncbi:hypothetical protein MMC11_006847 [Xylographa trunciseda]|nr:hypothetical protein [Xylographa trunciseda]
MDYSEDIYSGTDMDEDLWPLPEITDFSTLLLDSWLPELEGHDDHRSPLEMPSPEEPNDNIGLEQTPAAIMDVDVDINAFMGDLESTGIIENMNDPNWLDNFLAEFDDEAIPPSLRSLSSYYSRRGTRHTQLSSARRNRSPTASDLEQNLRRSASTISRTHEFNQNYLYGVGQQFDQHSTRNINSLLQELNRLSFETMAMKLWHRLESRYLLSSQDGLRHHDVQIGKIGGGREAAFEVKSPAQLGVVRLLTTPDVNTVEVLPPSIDKWLAEIPTGLDFYALQAQRPRSTPSTATTVITTSTSQGSNPGDVETVADKDTHISTTEIIHSHEYARSAAGSAGSGGSHDSMMSSASFVSHASWRGRKGRLKDAIKNEAKISREESARLYWCTWCRKTFKKPSDWKRHEESQHAPRTEWICMPNGPKILVDEQTSCALCGQTDPDINHLHHGHNQHKCLEGDPEDRKFDRKDHLFQHLRIVHNIKTQPQMALTDFSYCQQSLHASGTEPLWVCGFCGARWLSWEERCDHVSKHMKMRTGTWIKCACVGNGYRPTLQPILASIGLQQIWYTTCHTSQWCGELEEPLRLPCSKTIQDVWFQHLDLYPGSMPRDHSHGHTLRGGNISRIVGIPEEACIIFWCGFCQRTLDISGRGKEVAYDCERLKHIACEHPDITIMKPVWLRLSGADEDSFYHTALTKLQRNLAVTQYPLRDQSRITKYFAKKLTEHQTQIGAPELTDAQKRTLEISAEDAVADGRPRKRLRHDASAITAA